jgi:hypothetical protein
MKVSVRDIKKLTTKSKYDYILLIRLTTRSIFEKTLPQYTC